MAMGLFQSERTYGNKYNLNMTQTLYQILAARCRTTESIKRVMLGKPQRATLDPEHFEHLREEYDWFRNLLSNALTKKLQGMNILIYGKPGTGKTELAKTICKEIGASRCRTNAKKFPCVSLPSCRMLAWKF